MEPFSLATGVLSVVGFVLQVASGAMGMVDKTVTAHGTQRRLVRNLRRELDKTIKGSSNMQIVLNVMLGNSKDKTVKRMCRNPQCIIALQQLTKALESIQECIEKWVNNEDSAPITPHNALPGNRKSLVFIQAVFKHNFSPSTIDDAIEAVEELQFEVTKYREETESAFQHLWYLYNLQSFCNLQGHASVESLASVSTRMSVRTLASISSRIAECSAHYAEDDGELIDDSNDPIQWLQEQALRADLRPPLISSHLLSGYEGEDTIFEDDSSDASSTDTTKIVEENQVSSTSVLAEASGASNSDHASHPLSIDNGATLKTVSLHKGYYATNSVPPIQPSWPRPVLSALSPLSSTSFPVPNSAPTLTPHPYTPIRDPNIVRPSPVHAQDFRASTVSPPLHPPSRPTPELGRTGPSPTIDQQTMGGGKMSVSIDFGTTFSGVAYGSSRIAGGKVQQILNWPGSYGQHRKIPTALLYDSDGRVIAWGLEAKNSGPLQGVIKCEWFKIFLEPQTLRDSSAVDPRLPRLPTGKQAIDLIVDFLSALWEYAKVQITKEIGTVADLNSADVWLTVPASWDAKSCSIMRFAAITAGLVQSSRTGDVNWRDRLRIITEPEAAAVHCAHLTSLHRLKPSQNFIICDAGGGTVDLAGYKILGELQNLEIAELCVRSGVNCGSIFLDLRFQHLVRTLLADHPVHLDPTSLASFMYAFSNTDKLAYIGESQDDVMFRFKCFNPEDPDDPSVGLFNGELAIPGNLLRREVFDPVIEQVLALIEKEMRRIQEPLDALMMVGGFSVNEYLFTRVDDRFGDRLRIIFRPSDADTATLRGAVQYGLTERPLVSTIVSPKAYIMKVKLPAEDQDYLMRPAYISTSQFGAALCENRLRYLVTKGALVRKGQMIKVGFSKFSQTVQDRMFVAVLYTSDADKVMRYADEDEITELCKWTVDLGCLRSFQNYAINPTGQGFSTEFELGLELDSAEVRGVVLSEGQEVGRVVFDFLS